MSVSELRSAGIEYHIPYDEEEAIDVDFPEVDELTYYARTIGVQIQFFKIQASARNSTVDKAIVKGCKAEEKVKALPDAPKVEKSKTCTVTRLNTSDLFRVYPEIEAVQCVGNRNILKFKENEKPKLLYIKDSEEPLNCERFKKLERAYNVKFLNTEKISEVYAALKELPPQSLAGMVFDVQGSRTLIGLDQENHLYWDGAIRDKQAARALKNNAFIHLLSKEAAHIVGESPLYKLRDSLIHLGRNIILTGPMTPSDDKPIRTLEPLRFDFKISERQCASYSTDTPVYFPCESLPKDKQDPSMLNATREIHTKFAIIP